MASESRPLRLQGPTFTGAAACCAFLPRRTLSLGYRRLKPDGGGPDAQAAAPVVVVAGQERREFLVQPQVLERDAFKILLALAGGRTRDGKARRSRKKSDGEGEAVFVGVDPILFEHMLWLAEKGGGASVPLQYLEDIINFYCSQEL